MGLIKETFLGILTKINLTLTCSIVIFLYIIYTIFSQAKYNQQYGYVLADVKGYYSYLPQKFIYDDLQFSDTKDRVWFYEAGDENKRYIKYSTGMAIVYAPGFFIADFVAQNSSYERDGYTIPYQVAFICTALIFVFLALLYATKLLKLFYDDKTTALTLLIIFLGTNLLHYSTSFLSYSHLYSFTLILIFFYHSIQWVTAPTIKKTLLVGFVAGLFTLIRVIDVVFLLLPLIYGVSTIAEIKSRFLLFLKNWKLVLLAIAAGGIIWIPQILYMFYVWGEFKLNTYPGEKFFFSNPHIIDALFSFRNGWLIYSPLMILSLIGLLFYSFRKKQIGYILISALYIFVIGSWWCWWYEGFGNRAFINLYPLLILPLAYSVNWLTANWKKAIFSLPIIAFLVFLSLFQTEQFETRSYYSGQMTYAAYKETFLKKSPTAKFYDLLETTHPESAKKGINEYTRFVFDTLKVDQHFKNEVYTTEKQNIYGLGIKIPVDSANVVVLRANFSLENDALTFYVENKYAPCISAISQSMDYQGKDSNGYNVEHYFTYNEGRTCSDDSLNILLLKNADDQPIVSNLEVIYMRKIATTFIAD